MLQMFVEDIVMVYVVDESIQQFSTIVSSNMNMAVG